MLAPWVGGCPWAPWTHMSAGQVTQCRGEVGVGPAALPAWFRGFCQASFGPQALGRLPSLVCAVLPLLLPGLGFCPSEMGRH